MAFVVFPMITLGFALPLRLEYLSWLKAALLFAILSAPILYLGLTSLAGMTPIRKWVTIAVRLVVLLVLVLIISGVKWQRQAKDVEVYCLRDASDSTTMVQDYPGTSLQRSLDSYFMGMARDQRKKPDDTIGVIGFRGIALVESLADRALSLDGRGTPVSSPGTDAASAIQMAIASMSPDTMHRIVLAWDGNQTTGDMDAAISAAAAMHIPIDIFPLGYDLKNEIMLERVVAPSWRRENEPFTLDVYIRSTNDRPVKGKINITHETRDGNTPLTDHPVEITLQPGLNHKGITVPALESGGVHRFHAEFTPDAAAGKVDTISQNNSGDAFTVVRGKGEVLYVNNFHDRSGALDQTLVKALLKEKIVLHEVGVDAMPSNLAHLQDYDAIVLDNVPRGADGISTEQDAMLARYVHDFGGGLVMIGGENSFGAGGWNGSEVEKVLPVDMDIPAQRQVGKGALVLVMDPGEIPEGTYWGEQCAIKAVEALSSQDEVGIVDYNPMNGKCEWVLPLEEKGDGTRVNYAIKKMHDGDMPSFEDSLQLVLKGDGPGAKGLLESNARQKHVIIISDGDSGGCQPSTARQCVDGKISVSTVTAFAEDPSDPNVPPVMKEIAESTKGKFYGPINKAPNQLPQIFIKEAEIVRRSLIQENQKGIPVRLLEPADELVHGLDSIEPLFGQVLVSRKHDPRISVPLVSGKLSDPILAHWQAGLGKSVVFTSDAHSKWGALWTSSASYGKFWAQTVRSVSRAPMSSDFDVDTKIDGSKGHVKVSALDAEGGGRNFLSVGGSIVGPDLKDIPVRLNQTAPGVYEGDFAAPEAGIYVAGLNYHDNGGKSGVLISGVSMDSSPEMRDLQSNEAKLEEIRSRTNGRRLTSWDPVEANIFTHEGLFPAMQSAPIWDLLITALLVMILLDVAVRRIAWDWQSTKRMAFAAAEHVRSFTTLRRGDAAVTLAALKDVRRDVLQKRTEAAGRVITPTPFQVPRPDPTARFTAPKGVVGDLTELVAGAKASAASSEKSRSKPALSASSSNMQSLLEVKRRAREKMREAEAPQQPKDNSGAESS